ncbi:MAG TPA: hypothetical protein DDW67_00215 [Elusimicrobia bacterium]|jgi:Tfp pilus assembly protein PilX|nr:hypothetical protein [Elusimicrobiota bacterium]
MGKTTRRTPLRLRRGTILLQTLVVSVIISMIAVMVMKWVLARYTLASRVQRAAVAEARADGCAADISANFYSGRGPTPGACNGTNMSFTNTAGTERTLVVTVRE